MQLCMADFGLEDRAVVSWKHFLVLVCTLWWSLDFTRPAAEPQDSISKQDGFILNDWLELPPGGTIVLPGNAHMLSRWRHQPQGKTKPLSLECIGPQFTLCKLDPKQLCSQSISQKTTLTPRGQNACSHCAFCSKFSN